MAISETRKGHSERIQKVYDMLVADRLANGQSRTGLYPKRKFKLTPHRNPERVTRPTKLQKRQKRTVARQLRRNQNA